MLVLFLKEQEILSFFHLESVLFRSIFAAFSAFFFSLIFILIWIRWLGRRSIGQVVRDFIPSSHQSKSGVPTMGGLPMIAGFLFALFMWANLRNLYLLLVILAMIAFGTIGFVDDYKKIILQDYRGLKARHRYFIESLLALPISIFLLFFSRFYDIDEDLFSLGSLTSFGAFLVGNLPDISIPFFGRFSHPLGIWSFFILSYFLIVGIPNAVNLTDGLDGLAIGLVMLVSIVLGIFAYFAGNLELNGFCSQPYIPHADELTVLCSALLGSGLAFLWFNGSPAQLFMGDVGSLSLGAVLAVVALIIRQEFLLCFVGGVFVLETLSVILQVIYFKWSGGRRIFRMTPFHHHFELLGIPESKIVLRFWIFAFFLGVVGLMSLGWVR